MKSILKFSFLLMGPVLVLIYWRNAMKELDVINVAYEIAD